MAATHAAKHAIWLRRFFEAAGFPQPDPSLLFLDNRSSLDLAYNPEFHDRSKHIDIRHHWIRNAIAENAITIQWVPTQEMTADILTKALPRVSFDRFLGYMGMGIASD